MSVASTVQQIRIAGVVMMMSVLSAATAHADPPRPDALKMRNAPRAGTALAAPSQPDAPLAALQPTPAEPAATAQTDSPMAADEAVKAASDTLELCYALARRSDPSLPAQVTVHATARADGSVELRAQAASLGKGYLARCVQRKVGALVAVRQLPEAKADTRTIVLGAKAPAAR